MAFNVSENVRERETEMEKRAPRRFVGADALPVIDSVFVGVCFVPFLRVRLYACVLVRVLMQTQSVCVLD